MRFAREALENEINIISMIKSRRYFHMALTSLLSPGDRLNLKSISQYALVDPSTCEEGCEVSREMKD